MRNPRPRAKSDRGPPVVERPHPAKGDLSKVPQGLGEDIGLQCGDRRSQLLKAALWKAVLAAELQHRPGRPEQIRVADVVVVSGHGALTPASPSPHPRSRPSA